jgi:hypothetical protein
MIKYPCVVEYDVYSAARGGYERYMISRNGYNADAHPSVRRIRATRADLFFVEQKVFRHIQI